MATTRERRAERTRKAILDAAADIISERGPYNLSLREVARRIDYSPAGLYEYFGGKDEIIAAVVEEGFGRFATYLGSVSADLPARDYLLELGMSYIQFAVENPQHFMLIFNTMNVHQSQHDAEYISEGTFGLLLTGIQRAVDEGEFDGSLDVTGTAFGAWSLVHGMATLRLTHVDGDAYDLDGAAELNLRAWQNGLLAQPSANSNVE